MSENLAFKGKMVRFGLDWFGLVWFFVFQVVKVVLVNIRTKFELSMCLVCLTIEINVCSAYLQNVLVQFFSSSGNIVDLRTLPCYARAVLKTIEIKRYI